MSGGDGDDTFVYTTVASFTSGGAVVDLIDGGAGTADTVKVPGALAAAEAFTLTDASRQDRTLRYPLPIFAFVNHALSHLYFL